GRRANSVIARSVRLAASHDSRDGGIVHPRTVDNSHRAVRHRRCSLARHVPAYGGSNMKNRLDAHVVMPLQELERVVGGAWSCEDYGDSYRLGPVYDDHAYCISNEGGPIQLATDSGGDWGGDD